jgi:hypothetical protein
MPPKVVGIFIIKNIKGMEYKILGSNKNILVKWFDTINNV